MSSIQVQLRWGVEEEGQFAVTSLVELLGVIGDLL